MKSIEQIKQEVKDFLYTGMVFEYILKSNPDLYRKALEQLSKQDDISKLDLDRINFDYKSEDIKLVGSPLVIKLNNEEVLNGYYYDALYLSDCDFHGHIYRTESNRIEINFEATLRIFARNTEVPPLNGWIEIPTIINVLDKDSYMLWDRRNKEQEIRKLENQLKIKIKNGL